ncbi:MAG: tripartite tricarboxylate transporter substrate binding protein [Hyphomicrobiales bacterium]|nr:tripartite tricarboxylate transporter substrate binding protein [Hyphomicrobiales bacterium]MBV8824316.1 tripartite tricarboxylate transporter substrate binding protein [Hyphomicrobiales bacterium]MBV9427164.1 tripartite tricarboxylate transporter substrate binding protein [Bradyrhizobiaceae bacterium]
MTIPRRSFLHVVAGAALTAGMRPASGQDYPTRIVRLIVPFGPGGAPDILARLIGQWLSERLGQTFVVENRPGAGGNLGTQLVIDAPPDGHTLLLVSLANAVNVSLFEHLNFDFARDIAPVAAISRDPNVMVVNPSFPTHTLPEFVAYAKANPGKVNMASPGIGTSPHMAGELFKLMTGVDMVHVPYRASPPAITDLMGGQVQVYFSPIAAGIEYVRAGKLRALAVSSTKRSDALPEVPSIAELVPGYDSGAFYGIGAPAKTPAAIVERLNREIEAGLADATLKSRMADLGSVPFLGSPADFGQLMAAETDKWTKVVKFAGIKPQ